RGGGCEGGGGRGGGRLRPQPDSVSTETASRTTAHFGDKGLEIRFTVISPRRLHHTKIAPLWREPDGDEITAENPPQPNFRSFSSRFSQDLACANTFFGAVPP